MGGPRPTCSSRSCTHLSGVRPLSRAAGLIDELDKSDVPITVVAAPPGYGKTTLLAEWSRRHPSRFAWLSLDRHDNDLGRLVSYTAAALERIEPIDSELLGPSVGGRSVAAVASRVARAISAMKEPVVLVLDHVESLHNDDCRDTIAEVAMHLPAGSRLALATRADPPLPMARLRVGGDVVEVGVDELAMKAPEARRLLDGAGVHINDAGAGPSARAHRGMARRLVPRSSCVTGGRLRRTTRDFPSPATTG